MAIDLITGHQGVAHISAEQIANINNALMDDYGVDKVVRLDDGTLTQDGLTINVDTGFWRVNGFDMEIQEAETVYIDPTATGLSRIDNIYVEILQDIPTGSQRSEIVTVQGEAAASPVAPDAPTAPVLNTDILLQVTPLATVTVTEGAMVMTDLSVAYEMVTPQELAAVQTIAENAQTTANTANTSANNALGMIQDDSDAYSPSKAYKVGEYCIHDNVMRKCITPCSAAAWSVNQNCFEETTLTGAVTELNSALSNIGNITTNTNTVSIRNNSATDITNISLPAGKYIIVAASTYSTLVAGDAICAIVVGSESLGGFEMSTFTTGYLTHNAVIIVDISSTTTAHLRILQKTGQAVSVTGTITAMRIA